MAPASTPFARRTRILVTHQLDVLPRADFILVMERDDRNEGRIIQQGTYEELLHEEGVFQTLVQEYGSAGAGNSTSIEGEGEGQVKDAELEKDGSQVAVPEEAKRREAPTCGRARDRRNQLGDLLSLSSRHRRMVDDRCGHLHAYMA